MATITPLEPGSAMYPTNSDIIDTNFEALNLAKLETAQDVGNLINLATAKTTPVDADMFGIMDSRAGNILKKLSWANIKATLKTYFDTLYANIAGSITQSFGASTIELGHASDTTISRVSAGKIAVEGVNIGNEGILQNSQSAAYTTVLTDAGKHIYHPSADTTARTWTIDSNANVAYPVGTAITFVNDTSAGVLTIAITSDTLVLAGTGTTGSRTLRANGIATAIKVTSTRWIINGSGLT